ncbi:MAG: transposase [Selenomonadaceae bacterium]|nr:transposase [Selenomonadaceae bacterium]
MRSGTAWRDLPTRYGTWNAVYKCFCPWQNKKRTPPEKSARSVLAGKFLSNKKIIVEVKMTVTVD